MLEPVVDPGIQLYVEAPDAVIVAELPIQMPVGVATVVIVGVFTFTRTVWVLVQPLALEPVTV